MSTTGKTVFISYRRSVSSFIARSLFLDLRHHDYNVFMDVETIDSGEFGQIILNQIAAREHFILILALGSLERCSEPDDWLRREIEYAIDLQKNIIPVTTTTFNFEDAEKHLTGKLSKLTSYNSLPLYHEYFDEGLERLRTRFLKQPSYSAIKPVPEIEQQIVEFKIQQILSQPEPNAANLKVETDAERYFQRGLTHYHLGDHAAAIVEFTKSIQLNPRFVEAIYYRGNAYEGAGNVEQAIQDFNEAMALNPDYPSPYWALGKVYYFALKQPQNALGIFEHYLKLNGSNSGLVRTYVNEIKSRS